MLIPKQAAALNDLTGSLGRMNFDLVHFEVQGDRTIGIATDGIALCAASWPKGDDDGERHVDGSAFDEACKVAKAKKAESIEVPTSSAKTVPLPPYKKFEPVAGTAIRLELDTLLKVLNAISDMTKQAKKKGVEAVKVDLFIPQSSERPLEVRAVKDSLKVTGIVPHVASTDVFPRALEV